MEETGWLAFSKKEKNPRRNLDSIIFFVKELIDLFIIEEDIQQPV